MKKDTLTYLQTLQASFESAANADIAAGQAAYMKNLFAFYGIKTDQRRAITSPFFHKDALPPLSELTAIVQWCWKQPQREFQYFGQELVLCYKKQFTKEHIALFEFMLSEKSWWDTVDMISVHLVGNWYKQYPEEGKKIRTQWLHSGNFWLQRASILYQLKYKQHTDTAWMKTAITYLLGSKEFFINKAIGWVLREYTSTDKYWVIDFVEAHPGLSNLSKREALRKIN